MKEIQEYIARSGHNYFKEWLLGLGFPARAHVLQRLTRVQAGNIGDSKSLGDGVHELRIHWGSGLRVYFANIEREIILLLAGSEKRDQAQTVALAKRLWKEYKENI